MTLVLVTIIMTSVSGMFPPSAFETRWPSLLSSQVTYFCTVLVVLLRIAIRSFVIRKPGMDDYTIVVAVFLIIGYMLEILLGRENKIGFPASTLAMDEMTNQLKVTLSIEVTYYCIVGFIKMSILYLYLRFGKFVQSRLRHNQSLVSFTDEDPLYAAAISDGFRYLCYGTIMFTFLLTVISIIVTLNQCSPLEKMWDITGTTPGSCINATAFFYCLSPSAHLKYFVVFMLTELSSPATSGINIVTDIWILALPIKALRLVNRPLRERVALGMIFGAGVVATIMSCVRLQSIYIYTLSTDPFRDAIPV